jgi:arylsulfotransferase ASST
MVPARLFAVVGALSLAVVASAPATSSAAQVGPTCTPAALNRSAALAGGALTVSPAPGSRDAARASQISLLGSPSASILSVSVSGSRSGSHSGRLLPYSQADGASFQPDKPFVAEESVTVHVVLRQGSHSTRVSWSFTVAEADTVSRSLETPPPRRRATAEDHQSFLSRPDLKPPTVSVSVSSGGQSLGKLFLAPYAGPGQYGPMILDNSGRLLWFKPLPAGERAADLRVQEYNGQPVLTWWQDPMLSDGRSDAGVVIADSSYRQIAIARAGNGYKADLHAFQIRPNGAALTTVYDAIRCNLSAHGGSADGALADTLVQEIDLKTGLVRFEWHSLDHVALSDSYMSVGRRGGSLKHPWDWFHINAVSPEPDGSLLVSGRNTWAAYQVNHRNGQVLWRLGGKHSSFAMGPGTGTAWQHDVRWQPNGTVTFFDNGATPKVHLQSRGIVMRLDLRHMRATLVESFLHSPALVTASQGDLQPLSGGDWFTGWGQLPDFSEFSPNGKLVFDAHLPALYQSYTVFKFPWSGHPTEPPQIALRPGPHGRLIVYASWNGATEVTSWRTFGGSSVKQLAPLASAVRTGFETAITASHTPAYVAVQALDSSGAVLATSQTVKA